MIDIRTDLVHYPAFSFSMPTTLADRSILNTSGRGMGQAGVCSEWGCGGEDQRAGPYHGGMFLALAFAANGGMWECITDSVTAMHSSLYNNASPHIDT